MHRLGYTVIVKQYLVFSNIFIIICEYLKYPCVVLSCFRNRMTIGKLTIDYLIIFKTNYMGFIRIVE